MLSPLVILPDAQADDGVGGIDVRPADKAAVDCVRVARLPLRRAREGGGDTLQVRYCPTRAFKVLSAFQSYSSRAPSLYWIPS